MEEKECRVCLKSKLIKEFGRYKDPRYGEFRRRKICNACRRDQEANRYALHPAIREEKKAIAREFHFVNNYGISTEDLDKMKELQNYKCAICRLKKPLCVDHNHKSGKIRGLLCKACNFGIGYFHDSKKKLQLAIVYLEENS